MGLIGCPACGKEVSEQAKTCPSCGHPISSVPESIDSEPERVSRNNAVLGVVLLCFLAAFVFCVSKTGGGGSSSSGGSAAPMSAEKVEEEVSFLKTSGLITRTEEASGTIYVEPAIWNGLTVQAKENVAQLVGLWMKEHGATNGWCKVRDRYSGTLLAEGSQSWGAKIK